MTLLRSRLTAAAFAACASLVSATAAAQPAPAPAAPPAPPPPAAPAAAAPAAPAAPAGAASNADANIGPSPLQTALAPEPGGLTPDEVAKRASATSFNVAARQAELEAASARVDQALIGYFPRVTLTASYTRLSPVTNSFGGGGGLVGAAHEGPLRTGPCPGGGGATCVVDSAGTPVASQALSFPVFLNNYSLTAGVILPISDYVLRISQAYGAASHAENAARLNVEAARLQAGADGQVSFYNWLRARGQVVVAEDAVAQARAHLTDARRAFDVGLLSKADVVRLQAQVASAEQLVAEAEAFRAVTESQLRTALHTDKPLTVGVDVMGEQVPTTAPLDALERQALARRLEIRALDETEYSLKGSVNLARAGYAPRIDGFADATYANPNQRIFPASDTWRFTWDVGVRATWVLNDIATAAASASEAKARVAQVAQQKQQLRDALRLEVDAAYYDLKKAAANIAAADEGVAASEESLRVRQQLFRVGKATAVDIIDAETELTRARLSQIDARVGLLAAKSRLEHATGADVK
jgi:outer membrane protein TolC